MYVGLLGTGKLAVCIAAQIRTRGFSVRALQPDEAELEDVVAARLSIAADIRDLAEICSVFLVTLEDVDCIRAHLAELVPLLRHRSTIVLTAALDQAFVCELAELYGSAYIRFVDAALVMAPEQDGDFRLLSLCGGDGAVLADLRPVLECYSREIHHIGPLGAGQIARLSYGVFAWAQDWALAEVLALAKAHQIDPKVLREFRARVGNKPDGPSAPTTLPQFIKGLPPMEVAELLYGKSPEPLGPVRRHRVKTSISATGTRADPLAMAKGREP